MKIDKKIIKELVDSLAEFNLTELEYQEGEKKVKVSRASKGMVEQIKTGAVVSPNKSVLNDSSDNDGIRIKSPLIGTAYLAPEPGAKKFAEVGDKIKKGQTVKKGEVIAALGSSGKVSKPQLHFELRDSNGPLNPLKYLP